MRCSHLYRRKLAGVTLVELLIVIAILGILVGTVVPAFSSYMVKAKRQDATALLHGTVQRLESCFTLEGVYNGSCSIKSISDEGYYSLTAVRNEQSYTLSAVPVSGLSQAGDSECATFRITSTGEKNATGTQGKDCWR